LKALLKRRKAAREGKPVPSRQTCSQVHQFKIRSINVVVIVGNEKVLMDDNLMELTKGRPFPLKHKAKVSLFSFTEPLVFVTMNFETFVPIDFFET
jgi:hypothetical protein